MRLFRLRRRGGCLARLGGCLAWLLLLTLGAVVIVGILGAVSRNRNQAGRESTPGPTAAPTPTPVPANQRLVFTYYFYWYDATTGGHLDERSGLRYHPPPEPAPSWRSVEWQKKQLADMAYAGIDVVLPVYWGFQRPDDDWSWRGLAVLAEAWRALRAEGTAPPRVGMFFDTSIIDGRDLTTDTGKAFFYANVKDFFSRIPQDQWALVAGGPVIFLFTSDFTSAVDQSTMDYMYEHFQADFGVRPYLVREVSWDYPILRWEQGKRIRDYSRPIVTENSYLWAAAIHGFVNRGGVAAVGPGYDDHLVPGRGKGAVTDRRDGAFYRQAFEQAIASGKPLLAIETWNEFHEGSGIAETVEFGRQYLDMTRELTAAFHAAGR